MGGAHAGTSPVSIVLQSKGYHPEMRVGAREGLPFWNTATLVTLVILLDFGVQL